MIFTGSVIALIDGLHSHSCKQQRKIFYTNRTPKMTCMTNMTPKNSFKN